ncbi:MAG: DUF2339 domain-containing protein [Bacteroidota bacterium]
MDSNREKIDQLQQRLETLLKQQDFFAKEILELKKEVFALSAETETPPAPQKESESIPPPPAVEAPKETPAAPPAAPPKAPIKQPSAAQPPPPKKAKKTDLEKFIGENLINKIGIVITVIGVAIGAKYSIDNDLISPLTRIILGYVAGLGLLGIGLRLRKNYENYSAVLVSGAMAIMYFITFSAFNFYDLIPQWLAFSLMFVFTAFTVIAALSYNRQLIAHIGLVGAYAVPFLLSDETGQAIVLFTYMAIINVGVLVISFKKYWKALYYVAFFLTWIIYGTWFAFDYAANEQFKLGFTFLSVFFAIFYITFLAYKLRKKEPLDVFDIFFIVFNSFIYYGIGYLLLDGNETGTELLGVFTLGNAVLHFVVTAILYRRKKSNLNLFYMVAGLVLVFLTIAIPVQLDGNWVTLLWAFEAALLFWLGRTKGIGTYEWISYILMVLAFFSLIHDWIEAYDSYRFIYREETLSPFMNVHFLTSMLVVAAISLVIYIANRYQDTSGLGKKNVLRLIFSFLIPAGLILTLYFGIRFEIMSYFNQLYGASEVSLPSESTYYQPSVRDDDLRKYRIIWILNYTLLFLSVLAFVNAKKIKNTVLGYISFGLNLFAILVFLTQGLLVLSNLRESYLEQTMAEYFHRGSFNITIRYISLVFLVLIMMVSYQFVIKNIKNAVLKRLFNLILHIIVVWVLSSELLHWLDIAENNSAYKLGLSILWGVYSLFLIVLGIWKNKQHLRIGAIVLFGITLLKLFFYDIAHLNTLSKTIVFVSLGVLLLLISFLYNKYKNKMLND